MQQRLSVKKNGFTLVELIVVIAIIGILAAIGVPQMRAFLGRIRVEEQTKRLFTDMVSARDRAMNRNRYHFVVIDTAPAGQDGYSIWEDTNPVPDGDRHLQQSAPADTLVQRTTVPCDLQGLTAFNFDPEGIVHGNGSLWVVNTYQPQVDCITLSSTRIRMGRWDGAHCQIQ